MFKYSVQSKAIGKSTTCVIFSNVYHFLNKEKFVWKLLTKISLDVVKRQHNGNDVITKHHLELCTFESDKLPF